MNQPLKNDPLALLGASGSRNIKSAIVIWLSVLLVTATAATSASGQTSTATPSSVPRVLDLKTATELMLSGSPILSRERQAIGVARGNLIEAQQRPNPTLDLSSQSYPVFEDHPGSFFNDQELTFLAGQTIETAGKRGKRTLVANKELLTTESTFEDVVRLLKLELKTRYFAVGLAQAQSQLAQELVSQYDEVLRLNEARYKQGEISGLEFARLQTERFRFANDLAAAELQLKNARAALLELLGIDDLAAEFTIAEPLQAAPPTSALEEWQRAAEDTRPDLRAQRQRVERELANMQLQKANAIPDVTPSAGYKRDFGQNTLAVGVNVPLPLFNRNRGGIARSESENRRQNFELSRVRLQVRREVQQAYNAVQTQSQLVQALQSNYVPSAKKVRDIAQQSFRAGAVDLIGFLDAERIYRETLRTYNQALYDQRIAIAGLQAATGKEF